MIGELIQYSNNLSICTKVSNSLVENQDYIEWMNINESYRQYYILHNDEKNFFGTIENGDYIMITLNYTSVILTDFSKCKLTI